MTSSLNWQVGSFKRGVAQSRFPHLQSLAVKNLLPQGFPCQFTLWIIWSNARPHSRDRRCAICAFSGQDWEGQRHSSSLLSFSIFFSPAPGGPKAEVTCQPLQFLIRNAYISPSGRGIEGQPPILVCFFSTRIKKPGGLQVDPNSSSYILRTYRILSHGTCRYCYYLSLLQLPWRSGPFADKV